MHLYHPIVHSLPRLWQLFLGPEADTICTSAFGVVALGYPLPNVPSYMFKGIENTTILNHVFVNICIY